MEMSLSENCLRRYFWFSFWVTIVAEPSKFKIPQNSCRMPHVVPGVGLEFGEAELPAPEFSLPKRTLGDILNRR